MSQVSLGIAVQHSLLETRSTAWSPQEKLWVSPPGAYSSQLYQATDVPMTLLGVVLPAVVNMLSCMHPEAWSRWIAFAV